MPVTIRNGVLKCDGIGFDVWDMCFAVRLASKVPGGQGGAKRLEISLGGE